MTFPLGGRVGQYIWKFATINYSFEGISPDMCIVMPAYRNGGQFIDNSNRTGSGQIWLDDVQCDGTETDITNCRHSRWGMHNCAHRDDVVISCFTRNGL